MGKENERREERERARSEKEENVESGRERR